MTKTLDQDKSKGERSPSDNSAEVQVIEFEEAPVVKLC